MKSQAQALGDVGRLLSRTWAAQVVAEAGDAPLPEGGPRWPARFPLGAPATSHMTLRSGEVTRWTHGWRDWAAQAARDAGPGVRVDEEPRRPAGTPQSVVTHLRVDDIDTAARLVGAPWPTRLRRARARVDRLLARAGRADPARMLAATDDYTDTGFDLLIRAADYFAQPNRPMGRFTVRQVPVEGLHSKWLHPRRKLVAELAGLGSSEELGLLPAHPARIHFTYLDPMHLDVNRDGGPGRRHDSASVGDNVALPYAPRVVLISENKTTAVNFPPVLGGVAVEGEGKGAGAHATFDWIRDAPLVVYWGDMDADGLEILHMFREAGVPAVSMLMDLEAYRAWERYGVNEDPKGKPLGPQPERDLPLLLPHERDLYAALCSTGWVGPRRVEQELIPLEHALAHLDGLLACPPPRPLVATNLPVRHVEGGQVSELIGADPASGSPTAPDARHATRSDIGDRWTDIG